MKRFYTLMLAFAVCVSFRALGQSTLVLKDNANINANCNGYLEILPQGYNPGAPTVYPTIIFFMGINSTGPGTLASLQSMITSVPANPPSQPTPQIGNGFIQDMVNIGTWPNSFSGGNKFIVIVPQFITNFNVRRPTPQEVNDVINRVVSTYKVDVTRLYLTGNSSGGEPVWDYPAFSSTYANRIAAIVPFCGTSFPSKEKADVIRNADIAVWAFHNDFDGGVPSAFTKDYVSLINNPSVASPEVKQTIFPQGGHDCWASAYQMFHTENGLNIYDWMLQFQRPVTKANAGDDQNITLPTSTGALSGSGTGPGGAVTSINWQLLSGPGGGAISNPSIMNPTISGLVYGTYFYRLSLTDGGGTATDDVVINVYPPRIQAESPAASSGLTSTPAVDEGGGNAMRDWIAPGAFGEYNINVASAGTYILRFRIAAWYQTPSLVVKSGSTILANMNVYWTEDWNNWITMTRNITLPAGSTTLRIESTSPGQDFNLNWIQLLGVGVAGPLPVKFSLINSACVNGKVRVSWKTSFEENLSGFAIEKSRDGQSWNEIGQVKATGAGSEQSYFFLDNEIGSGNQYRIVGIDIDGRKTYSNVITGNCSGKYAFNVYPNPVVDETQISLDLQHAAKVKLVIVDNKGSVVLQQEKNALAGSNLLSINMSSLPAGTYTLTAQWDNETRSSKLIKQ